MLLEVLTEVTGTVELFIGMHQLPLYSFQKLALPEAIISSMELSIAGCYGGQI